MSRVAGIDVSTQAVNLVLLDENGDTASERTIRTEGDNWSERVRSLRTGFPGRAWFENAGVYLVGLEDPMSRQAGSAKKLGAAYGAVLVLLPSYLTVIELPPTEWKRETCGVPMAPKEEVAQWVGRTWAEIPALVTQDTLDAYAIAYAARKVNRRAVEAA